MDDASPTTQQPTPPPDGPGQPGQPGRSSGPRVSREEMKDLRRLRRSVTDRHIAGVAGGLARHLDVDAVIVRVALVVAVFFGGAGLLAYVGAWILVPEEGTDDEPLGLDPRSRTLALGGVGVLALLCALGDWAGAFWFPWPLAIIAAIVVLFLHHKEKGTSSDYRYAPPSSGATGPASYAAPTHDPGYAPAYDPTHDPYDPTAYAPAGPGDQWGDYARPPGGPRQPRNPRRRGPILFFFTLALIALAEGVLGVVDLAGVDVTDSAYPALALGITAVMLLVGSFWGRAGGLIALGLVAALVTAATTIGGSVDDEDRLYVPASAGAVQDSYEIGGGRLTLDLSDVSDVDALDGRDVTLDAVGGQIEVIVPDGVDVDVRAQVVAGDVRVFDQRQDGFDVSLDAFRDGGDEVPDMSITIDLVAGEVLVREAT